MTRIYVYVTISGGQCMPQKISTITFDDRDLVCQNTVSDKTKHIENT